MTSDLNCGAATLLTHVKNPIQLARRVMEGTPHTFLSAGNAEEYARKCGLELLPNDGFKVHDRIAQWKR